MTFLDKLVHNCQQYGDKVALEFCGETAVSHTITYHQLEQTVRQTMAYLQANGVQKGDRIALHLPKCLPFIYLHLAIMRLEAISLPLNPGYPPHELHYFLQDAAARLLFSDASAQTALQPMLDTLDSLQAAIFFDSSNHDAFMERIGSFAATAVSTPQDRDATCLMIYTSGTTGRPKGAELTHGNLTANLDSLHTAWGWQADDILLHVLPIFHVHGLIVALHGALHAGATAVLLPKFDPETTLRTLQERRCTIFMGVPTIHHRLVSLPEAKTYDLSHMRLLTSGSDRLP
ncbi:MAG: AMP-binding protein, partial [Anaerolineales bacterium]|nr:AMP-binding protein [Anaerolineales bacterium]